MKLVRDVSQEALHLKHCSLYVVAEGEREDNS